MTIMKGLSHPWSLAFMPDGNMLVTERPGRLWIVRKGVLDPQPIRLRDDGSVPPDNPFVGKPHKPEIYSYGHRNMLGLTIHPVTREIWENENGPLGGDEVNILKKGANYGWPLVSYGRQYSGAKVSKEVTRAGLEDLCWREGRAA